MHTYRSWTGFTYFVSLKLEECPVLYKPGPASKYLYTDKLCATLLIHPRMQGDTNMYTYHVR